MKIVVVVDVMRCVVGLVKMKMGMEIKNMCGWGDVVKDM